MAGTVNYFEIGGPEPEQAQRFYAELFDWRFGEPSPVGYRIEFAHLADPQGNRFGVWRPKSSGEAVPG